MGHRARFTGPDRGTWGGLLCVTVGHRARFAVPDRGAWGGLLCVTVGHRARFAVPARFASAWQVTKIKYGEERFSIWLMEFFCPAAWHVALG